MVKTRSSIRKSRTSGHPAKRRRRSDDKAAAGCKTKTKTKTKAKAGSRTFLKEPSPPVASDHLASYFRDLSEHDLLDPEREREIAQGIEEQETLAWERLLSYPATVDYILNHLEARLDNSLKDFRKLRRAAEGSCRGGNAQNRARLSKVAGEVAPKLRALDLDRKHVEAVIAELERQAAEPSLYAQLPFAPAGTEFASYLHQVKLAMKAASQLRDEFVRANLRLVVTMARRYDRGGMPLADLIQEGNLGLMHAVSRFDYRRGLRFSTYACWWIRHAIGRALADKSRAVRIPVHMLEAQQQLHKVALQLTGELGRKPTAVELARAADLPMSKLNQMHRYLMGQAISLDRPSHDEDDRALGDILADPSSEDHSPVDHLTTKALAAQVSELMAGLSPIEADVLRQRFGLDDDEERTFREIGDQYDLSRERIRQIQNAALGKLRRALERTGAA